MNTSKNCKSGFAEKAAILHELLKVRQVKQVKIVARLAGCSKASIGRYMTGETEPKDSVWERICVAMGEYGSLLRGSATSETTLPESFIDANHNGRIDPQDAKLHKADALAHEIAWTKQFELAVADGHLSPDDKASLAFIESQSERHEAAAAAVLQHC